ncbi:MAG: Gldg family protein [Eubacteriales bacterium]|nr:Gldg family protein [Eubacteriales bacterium]
MKKKQLSLRAGSYSFATLAIVIAIAVFANLFVANLPESFTKIDLTSDGVFSLSAQTESIVASLEDEISIYWVVQSGREDEAVGTLLGRYESLSKKIRVEKVDPDVSPTFTKQYTSETLYNNSLVVESGSRSKYVSYEDFYAYDYSDYYSTGDYSVNFAGENAVTSAIDFVTTETVPTVYLLSGHGEQALPSTTESDISSQNIEIKTLSLITENAVPEDSSCVLIFAPADDISGEEKELLVSYAQSGGSIILVTDPAENGKNRDNLNALAETFGMKETEGIVVEGNANHFAYGMPYYLLPEFGSHTIMEPLSSAGYYVLLPIAHSISLDESENGMTPEILLQTSGEAYIKTAGYEMTTYEKEDGDPEGQFVLSAITETPTDNGSSSFIWIAGSAVLDEMTNIQVAGGNEDFFMNCLSYICGEKSSISIRTKSLSYDMLSLTSSQTSVLRLCMVFLIPAVFMVVGIDIRVRRKRR